MNLIFEKSKETDITPFIAWLNLFKGEKISDDSIVLEIDFEHKKFISKCFTAIKDIARYSEIDFNLAGFEISKKSDIDNLDSSKRINIGIDRILGKFIDILKMMSTAETFKMIVNFDIREEEQNKSIYETTDVEFVSKTLKFKVKTASLDLFTILTDDFFKTEMFTAPKAIKISITMDTIKNILSVSDIMKSMSDHMIFYTRKDENENKCLFIQDSKNTYNYKIGPVIYEDDETVKDFDDIVAAVFRSNFLIITSNLNDTSLLFEISTEYPSRILITSDNGKTQSLIATVSGLDIDIDK